MPQHRLPARIYAMDLPAALRLSSGIGSDPDDIVVCDASELTFVDPVGLCLLAVTTFRLSHRQA